MVENVDWHQSKVSFYKILQWFQIHCLVLKMLHSTVNKVQKADFLCNTKNSSRDVKCNDQLKLSDTDNNATLNFPW